MTRLNMVVEGQAEETFVVEVLARHLAGFGVAAVARRVEFGRKKQLIYRGGLLEYPKLRKDVVNWLKQDQTAIVTTMVDLYALPDDFPMRLDGKKVIDPYKRVSLLEDAFAKDVDSKQFIPYIQLHEYEAMLFTQIGVLRSYYPAYGNEVANLEKEASRFKSPELIDEGKTTAPSKRILREVPIYDKILAGSLMVMDIGLETIRPRCAHFDAWLAKLEKLGDRGV